MRDGVQIDFYSHLPFFFSFQLTLSPQDCARMIGQKRIIERLLGQAPRG